MAKDGGSISILKEAFDLGYKSFFEVALNDKGHYQNPICPYQKGSLPAKEYQRGFDRGFYEQQRKA